MKKFNVIILLISATIIVVLFSLFMVNYLNNSTKSKDQVYLVIKTSSENTEFWLNTKNGANIAGTELGVEVIVKGPNNETDIQAQIDIMEEIILKKPKAIAIAASDYNELSEVCSKAIDAGISLVTFDSDVNIEQDHSFVGTNNRIAAQRLGHELGVLMKEEGMVAIVSHVEGSFTAIERVEGFKQGMKPYKDIAIVGDVYYADNNREISYKIVKKIIEDYPTISGIYATNEITFLGTADAIRDLGLESQIRVVGFDMNKEIALMIEQGIIDAAMVQKPFNMGYIAIRESLEVLKGKEPENIDTGAVLINKENMFLPENQKMIVPIVN